MGEPTQPEGAPSDDLLSGLGDNIRKVDASELHGQVRVLKKSELRAMVQELLDRFGSADKQQLIDRREQLLKLIEEAQARQDEMRRLLEGGAEGMEKLAARNQEVSLQADSVRAEEEERFAQMQPIVQGLQQKLNAANAEIDGTRSRIEELKAKMELLRQEIAALQAEMEGDPVRMKLRDLEARAHALAEHVDELLAALDFFTLEDCWELPDFQSTYTQTGQIIEPITAKLQDDDDKLARATKIRDEMVALNGSVEAETGKLEKLLDTMNGGEAGVQVVMNIIEKTRRLGASRDRLRILADSLVVLSG